MSIKKLWMLLIGIGAVTGLVVLYIFITTERSKPSNDLVKNFYQASRVSYDLCYYDENEPSHLQPVLFMTSPELENYEEDQILGKLFSAEETKMDNTAKDFRKLALITVYYGRGTEDIIELISEDGRLFFKRAVGNTKILYHATYFPGIEAEVLKNLGNDGWYVYDPNK